VVRVAVLASGSGTILDAALGEGVPVEVVVVDRPCTATAIAEAHGVPWVLVERHSYGDAFDRDAYTDEVVAVLRAHAIELVVMAGYGTILRPTMFDAFAGHVISTHPALLPSFKGWHAVEAALDFGVKVTGAPSRRHSGRGRRADRPGRRARPDRRHGRSLHRHQDRGRRIYIEAIKGILDRGSVLACSRRSGS
jgi:phosphoribosylglycinamide formyltransferase-1